MAKKPHFGISKRFTPLRDEGKPRPYNANVFWFGAIEIPVRVGDPVVGLCRRYSPRKPGSVTHLTFADTFWRSVQTCSVLLHTEAGGMPAFQSTSATRNFFSLPLRGELMWYNEGQALVANV
ncbi:MAG: hypothetical protein LBQ66_05995 [Planctomycetaceae bacterium]|nr:hypothetical protein [Planctomycetaceae bacterium]